MSEHTSSPNAPNRPVAVGSNDSHASDPKGHGHEPQTTPRDRGSAEDAGRTSGGGNSGHKATDDVKRSAPIRNNPR